MIHHRKGNIAVMYVELRKLEEDLSRRLADLEHSL